MADPARQASAKVARDSWSCSSLQRTPNPWGSKGSGGGSQFPVARRKEPPCRAFALILVDWDGKGVVNRAGAGEQWGESQTRVGKAAGRFLCCPKHVIFIYPTKCQSHSPAVKSQAQALIFPHVATIRLYLKYSWRGERELNACVNPYCKTLGNISPFLIKPCDNRLHSSPLYTFSPLQSGCEM